MATFHHLSNIHTIHLKSPSVTSNYRLVLLDMNELLRKIILLLLNVYCIVHQSIKGLHCVERGDAFDELLLLFVGMYSNDIFSAD